MAKEKAYELRKKGKADLIAKLGELRAELATLRVAKVTGGAASKLAKIGTTRKNIARVLTVYNQNQAKEIRGVVKGYKYAPKDLRVKKTRAIRRALTKSEKNVQLLKTKKKAANLPLRRFAVKA